MDQFHHPSGFDGRYHSARYSHSQYLSPHPADEDQQPSRRRNSTGRDYRTDHHARSEAENEEGLRRARSSRRPADLKSRDQSRASDGKKAGRPVTVETDDDDDDDARDMYITPPAPVSMQARYGEHDYQVGGTYEHYQNPQPQANVGTAPQHINVYDHERHESRRMAHSEHASKSNIYATLGSRVDRSASRKVHRSQMPTARLQKTKQEEARKHEETRIDEGSSPETTTDQQSRHAHAGEHGYMRNRSSSRLSHEDDRLDSRRSTIPVRPSIEARARSYHGSPASNPRPNFSTTESFPTPHVPRFSVSHDPPEPSQSINFSIGPGDSRSDTETTRRPRSSPGSTTTSTSFLSLPTSVPGSSTLGPKSYQYLPLGDMEIRLIRILPERMSKLKCEIVHRMLEDSPDYIAVSYAWGDGVDTKPLVLQGATIPVAASLYDALKAIRQKKTEALVWVDALCIDQQNKDERAMQVRLMGHIYSRAMSVAIWLGPDADDSALAIQLLEKVAQNVISPQRIRSLRKYPDSAALFELFKRDYWKRLWVVQEVLLAEKKIVYCGHSILPWELYRQAADAFWGRDSDPHIRQGPASFPQMSEIMQRGDESLLEVMRTCRKKLSENPRDKVFGILGLLPEATQREFPVDYSQSVKTVYTDVVDYLISTADQLDVIRESIHFPIHVNTTGLPTWCPDWSHIPEVSGLSRTLGFDASRSREGPSKAQYRFYDERRKLEISAIPLDAIRATGVAVGTFCASQDYLTAFLHWRAILLDKLKIQEGNESHPLHKAFCRTLCLGQVPAEQSQPRLWHNICYHVFSSLIRERLPRLPMDEGLEHYADETGLIDPDSRRKFLQDHFGNRMMGRSFCVTEQGLIGMGSGYMTAGDLVVVPFGCSTPILLRPEGRRDEYRYVGDVYIEGYMHGEAVQQLEAEDVVRTVAKYMLC